MALRSAAAALAILLQFSGGAAQQDSEGEHSGCGLTSSSARLSREMVFCSTLRMVAGIEKCGFVSERHEVSSRDGYRTVSFRMVQPGGGAGTEPVLLQHGLLASSDAWFQLGAGSLPCLLATTGYDVWLPNSRGNSYSRTHSTYNTDTLQYWAFSFHEMAVYDLSATIDHVRSVTGAEKVSFVGHSLGGTLIFVLLSVLPEYNKRVTISVSLAPICFMGHTTSHLLRLLAYAAPYFEKPLNWMSNGEIAPFPDLQGSKSDVFNFQIGAALGEAIDFKQMVQQEMALGSESPGFLTDGTSLRTVLHLAQLITRGNFSWYDFGKRNSAEYKRPTPPNYNLRRITATQLIMYSDADHLVVGEDVRRLCSELPEGVGVCYKIKKTGFKHSDFLSSDDAQEYVYDVMFGELDPDPNEAQGKPAGSQIRGRATTLRGEDWPPAMDDEPVATPPGRQPVTSSVRGKPVFPMRGKNLMPKMQFRTPSPPEERQQPAASPVRGLALPPPEQDGSGSPPEEGTIPRPSEWEVAETTPQPAASSLRRRGENPTERGRAGARGRIASRVRGMAAEPEVEVTSAEGGVTQGTAAPERKPSAHPRVRGAAATAAPVPAAAASGRGAEEEADPTAPVKVCRYYATAGRLQRICYEEYV